MTTTTTVPDPRGVWGGKMYTITPLPEGRETTNETSTIRTRNNFFNKLNYIKYRTLKDIDGIRMVYKKRNKTMITT